MLKYNNGYMATFNYLYKKFDVFSSNLPLFTIFSFVSALQCPEVYTNDEKTR